jgi:Fic family protein
VNPEAFKNSSSGWVRRVQSGYYAFIPNPLPPSLNWTSRLIQALSQADRALGELAGLGHMVPNPYLLVRPFIRREAVLSSRIEGTRASLTDVYTYEAVQLSLFEQEPDVEEVYNYVRALNYGLERLDTLPVSLRLIREIHEQLLTGVRGQEWTPGEFRRSQNWIGPPGSTLNTAVFIPPPVSEMHDALHQLELFIHATTELPPLVRLALIHYQFEAIHPFLDGNGRIGRLLLILLLTDWKLLPQPLLYLSAYFEQHRQTYYDHLLSVSQQGAWEAWLIFFLEGVHTQSADVIQRARRLQALREAYREQVQRQTQTAAVLQVVDLLFARPVLTVKQTAAELDISYAAANRHIGFLAEQGLLQEITGHARNRIYRATNIIAAIDDPLT